jgi:hypothetical protein
VRAKINEWIRTKLPEGHRLHFSKKAWNFLHPFIEDDQEQELARANLHDYLHFSTDILSGDPAIPDTVTVITILREFSAGLESSSGYGQPSNTMAPTAGPPVVTGGQPRSGYRQPDRHQDRQPDRYQDRYPDRAGQVATKQLRPAPPQSTNSLAWTPARELPTDFFVRWSSTHQVGFINYHTVDRNFLDVNTAGLKTIHDHIKEVFHATAVQFFASVKRKNGVEKNVQFFMAAVPAAIDISGFIDNPQHPIASFSPFGVSKPKPDSKRSSTTPRTDQRPNRPRGKGKGKGRVA